VPEFKIGGLVSTEHFSIGLLLRIYDHETGECASIDDASDKLLLGEVEVGGQVRSFFLHELEPLPAHS
jgi:hypothetical protein